MTPTEAMWAVRSRGDWLDAGPVGQWAAWFVTKADAELFGKAKFGPYHEVTEMDEFDRKTKLARSP